MDGQYLPPAAIFQSEPTISAFHSVPPAPFIVPAVLDALSRSKYAKFTSVVPGEAEVYCASAARKNGGIILSNDSDLYVHDLGTGAFVYLDSVEMPPSKDSQQGAKSEDCKLIELRLNCPRDIAKRLGLSNLQELAYQFARGYSQTLPEAIKAAKKHQWDDETSFNSFAQEYIKETLISSIKYFSPEALARLSIQSQFLDPRISELVYQLESKDCHIAEAYLLCLIEDPCRSSAWLVSSGQRTFAYSICALPRKRKVGSENLKIEECNRRGQDFIMQEISLLTEPEIVAYANSSNKRIQKITDTFSEIPINLTWRIYALFEVYRWYLNTDRTPSARELLKSALTGMTHPRLTWETTHLSAQIQAVLYSLRMIHQILVYIASATAEALPTSLRELATTLEKLPSLAQLMPSPLELASQTANLDIESVLHRLAMILQNEADRDGLSVIDTSEELLNAPMEYSPRKKCKKSKKKKKKGAEMISKGKPNNMFEMLM
ncbi:hypothetical protein ABVK25_001663 [Lepraria finkii]|uniref:Asteroid domain-containing protein n=1 Tax=Lepraria finkii TaxID=1340010 RepID=A0ABR4BJY3_9LECA